jgi:23S rRNA (adenine2503-C2)-methyltransferase
MHETQDRSLSETETAKPQLRGMNLTRMQALLTAAGFEKYRAAQLHQWVWRRMAVDFDQMHTLPKALRAWLAENTQLSAAELLRLTGEAGQTQKALFRLADGKRIESVVMRERLDEDEADGPPGAVQPSLCISSQVGCAVDCKFCLTGWGGYQRNLSAAEIVSQAVEIQARVLREGERINHIVFMGMGEPMLNLAGVCGSVRLLTDPDGFGLSKRRMTVSTAGIVPGIEKFGEERLGVGLAVSLNATTDAVRDEIMPINRKWNIETLIGALRRFPLEARRRITIEYVLMRGINDTPEDAQRLATLLRGLRCKVNLIMYNETPQLDYRQVDEATLERFLRILSAANMTVTVRWSKGREIQAACGQLAAHKSEGRVEDQSSTFRSD